MIYEHHRRAIEYITEKMSAHPQVEALLLSGSVAHGYNSESSDVDLNIIVPEEVYGERLRTTSTTFYESAAQFYPNGYFDGKFISLGYLRLVAERGNEPTRFALHDARILFDKTGKVQERLDAINAYSFDADGSLAMRFTAQLEGWHWYCGEALKRDDRYLLDVSVSRLILFAGRLILLANRRFYPYHKWFTRVLSECPDKPAGFMEDIAGLLADKSAENIRAFFRKVRGFKDWTRGGKPAWTDHFVRDTETVWMRQEEFIENA